MRSVGWTAATSLGFALTGIGLHSPGSSGVGNAYLEWDVWASLFGAFLGAIAGGFTGLLQLAALRARAMRLLVATTLAVAVAHALADGAPAIWGVPVVAGLSGLTAACADAWATRVRDIRLVSVVAIAWTGGWLVAVAVAASLGLSGGSDPATWATEHAVIGAILGLAVGAATSPAMRRILGVKRALSSAG